MGKRIEIDLCSKRISNPGVSCGTDADAGGGAAGWGKPFHSTMHTWISRYRAGVLRRSLGMGTPGDRHTVRKPGKRQWRNTCSARAALWPLWSSTNCAPGTLFWTGQRSIIVIEKTQKRHEGYL